MVLKKKFQNDTSPKITFGDPKNICPIFLSRQRQVCSNCFTPYYIKIKNDTNNIFPDKLTHFYIPLTLKCYSLIINQRNCTNGLISN